MGNRRHSTGDTRANGSMPQLEVTLAQGRSTPQSVDHPAVPWDGSCETRGTRGTCVLTDDGRFPTITALSRGSDPSGHCPEAVCSAGTFPSADRSILDGCRQTRAHRTPSDAQRFPGLGRTAVSPPRSAMQARRQMTVDSVRQNNPSCFPNIAPCVGMGFECNSQPKHRTPSKS